MPDDVGITEKEYAVIREIHKNHLPDQRTIATRTGISLGMTNLIIKRLIKKGYIKAKQLNQKKIQYLLTPQGFTEKAKKSYHFTLKTIGIFKTIREKIQELVLSEVKKGAVEFIISGNTELADITELAIKNIDGAAIKWSREQSNSGNNEQLFLKINYPDKNNEIDIINFLVEAGVWY